MVSVVSHTPSSSEILKDQLYLGNFAAAQCPELRKKLGITHLISVCRELPSRSGGDYTHLQISVEDTEYSDLLIHLPKTTRFIQAAFEEGGRVLIHCIMGVSRSTTVVAAFLMRHRKMDTRSALRYIKQRRPQVHPNYGFIKQLDAFAKCQFEPSLTNPVYCSWRKRQEQDVTCFLNSLVDTVTIIPEKLLLNSDFPDDPRQAESLLADLGITHVLSISPAEIPPSVLAAALKSRSHLPGAVQFLERAMLDGLVLVHSQMEVRACTVACACLMKRGCLAPDEAFSAIEDVLPLFNPTVNFSRNLELYDACGHLPTKNHPVVQKWVSSDRPENRYTNSRNAELSYPRRPSGSIITSSIPQALSSLSEPKLSDRISASLSQTTILNTPSSHSVIIHQQSSNSPSSAIWLSTTSSSAKDLGTRTKKVPSDTEYDLSELAIALKDMENPRSGKLRSQALC